MPSRFARNTTFSMVAGLSLSIGNFLSTVVIARLLGVEGTGLLGYALWIIVTAVTLVDLGIPSTLARYLPELKAQGKHEQSERIAAYLFRPYAAAVLLAAALFGAFATWVGAQRESQADQASLSEFLSDPLSWILIGACCGAQAFHSFTFGYLKGVQRFDKVASLTAISVVLQIAALAIGCALLGARGALIGYLVGSTLPAALAFAIARGDAGVAPDIKARVFRYASFAWAAEIAGGLAWARMEVFFLERFWGAEAVAFFTIALTLASLATRGPLLLTGGLLTFFSESAGKDEAAKIRTAYAAATRVVAFLVFPACLGMAAILPVLLPLLYGQAFSPAIPASMVLVSGAAVGAVGFVGASLTHGVERSDTVFYISLTGTIALVLAGLTIIPAYGVVGAAYARAGIQIFLVGVGALFIVWRLQCSLPLQALGRLLLAAIACAAAAHGCVILIPGLASIMVGVPLGAIVYLIAVRLLRALPEGDVARLEAQTRHLPWFARRSVHWALRLAFR